MTILIEDRYQVVGRAELAFEAALRERFVSGPAAAGPGRLVLAAWLPHGAGEGYEAVSLVAVEDGDELDRLYRWSASPAGLEWTTTLQRECYAQDSALRQLHAGDLSEARRATFGEVGAGDGRAPMYRLDELTVIDPRGAVAAITAGLAASAAAAHSVLNPVACWSPLLSVADEPTVSVLYRVEEGGFRRGWAETAPGEPWDGELAVEEFCARRRTSLLRTARGIGQPESAAR